MSDYPPSAPTPGSAGRPPPGEPPASIRTSVMLVWALFAITIVNAVLSLLNLDDLVSMALEAVPQGEAGAEAARAGVRAAVIGFVVFTVVISALWVVLAVFLRRGANWARIVLTILAALGLVFGLFGFGTPRPLVFTITSVVTLVLEAALLYFLWQKDSTSFLKSRPAHPTY